MAHRRRIATAILQVYKDQHARAGYVIPASVLAALSAQSGWSADEVEGGITYGYAEGWFADSRRNFLRLTEGGAAEITHLAAQPAS
jgi:hypothetical protein